MTDALPAAPPLARVTPRVLAIAAAGVVATLLLLAPALVNGFPFLFYDTGGYLDAAVNHLVKPGRSTVYGALLALGSRPDFWPVVVLQSALCVWVLALVMRVNGLGRRPLMLIALSALLTVATALPFVAGELMPDVFAGLTGLGLYLLLWRQEDLKRGEAVTLGVVIAFGGAAHSSVLAITLACVGAAAIGRALLPRRLPRPHLTLPLIAACGALVLTPVTNLALAGRFASTPGGTGFIFGRLLEDGLVHRYLADACPQAGIEKLCAARMNLPATADDFLWDDDQTFNEIGGFEGGAAEMRQVIIGVLRSYPLENVTLALRAVARQMVALQTGDLMSEELTDSYDVIADLYPHSNAAMMAARQQQNPPIDFDRYSAVHVPVGLVATLLLAVVTVGAMVRGRRDIALLTGSALAFLIANAAVCGILSNPHDRYQSRIIWVAVAALFIAAIRIWDDRRGGRCAPCTSTA